MIQFLSIVTRTVPEHIEHMAGKDLLDRIFALIDADRPVEEILTDESIDKQKVSTVLLKLVAENILVPGDEKRTAGQILLVTDSAADLPEQLVRDRNIVVVPLTVAVDGREYRDGVDISSSEFYQILSRSKSFPQTAPPSPEAFHQIFVDNIGGKDILGIFLSRRMSKTFDTANQVVRKNFNTYLKQRRGNPINSERMRIDLIDSRQVSMGTALLVLEASDKIRAGWPITRIKTHIEKMAEEVRVFFMVDNLDYLARGGRIGRAHAMLGNFFGFKPILGMTEGGVDAKSRAFGGKRAERKLIELMKDDLKGTTKEIRIGICHADAQQKADHIRELIASVFSAKEHVVSYFGPTVGSHTGPGAVGVAWLAMPPQ